MSRLRLCYVIMLGVIALASCEKETIDADKDTQLGYDYYPVMEGKYVIYDVEEISIDAEVGKYDTVCYQLKEQIIDSLAVDESGLVSYKMERYKKEEGSVTWDIADVWSVRKSDVYLIRDEENIPIVKQVYPMEEKQTWNANMFNTEDEEESELVSMDKQDTIGASVFSRVATIEEESFESLFEKRYVVSKYARSIGLVYKQEINIESQSSDNITIDVSTPILSRVTKGEITTWEIISNNFEN